MSKPKRAERIGMILLLLARSPNKLHTLGELTARVGCAKSTLSEDLTAVRAVLQEQQLGLLESVPGAAGGVRFLPFSSWREDLAAVQSVCDVLGNPERIVPGGFLYTADIFSSPVYIERLGAVMAKAYWHAQPELVVTVESQGIPIALMAARALGVPLVVARKETRVTDGWVVTLNYLSTSSKRLQTMSLPSRAVHAGQRALVVDDFVKGGGTIGAMCDMMREFSVSVVGACALVATAGGGAHSRDVQALMVLEEVDAEAGAVALRPAAWLAEKAEREEKAGADAAQ